MGKACNDGIILKRLSLQAVPLLVYIDAGPLL